jgi:hypothetical protein
VKNSRKRSARWCADLPWSEDRLEWHHALNKSGQPQEKSPGKKPNALWRERSQPVLLTAKRDKHTETKRIEGGGIWRRKKEDGRRDLGLRRVVSACRAAMGDGIGLQPRDVQVESAEEERKGLLQYGRL